MDTKLACVLRRCCNLPPHPSSGHRDAYVSLRIAEHYYERLDDPAAPPSAAARRSSSGGATAAGEPKSPALPSSSTASPNRLGTNSAGFLRLSDATATSLESASANDEVSPSAASSIARLNVPTERRRSSTFNPKHEKLLSDPSVPLREVRRYVDDVKLQSRMVASSLNPEYYETFIFSQLPIPVRRRSSSALLNCSASGASRRTSSSSAASGSGSGGGGGSFYSDTLGTGDAPMSLRRLKKVDPTYWLDVEVFDNTIVAGAGEKLATGSVLLDGLLQGVRQEVVVPLTLDPSAVVKGDDATSITAGENGAVATLALPPTVELIMEPVNFGVMPETKPEEPVEVAIHRAIKEELADVFSIELINRLHGIVARADAENRDGIGRGEMLWIMQELHFATGTAVPEDDMLRGEVDVMFKSFDHDFGETLDITEICAFVRNSKFANALRPRWRAPKPGFTASNVVAAANVAGCLWNVDKRELPEPYSYAGYRRPDGAVNDKTRKPKPMPNATIYTIKNSDAIYAELGIVTAGAAAAVAEAEPDSPTSATDESPKRRSVTIAAANADAAATTLAMQSIFGETLENMIVEGIELQHCTINNCHVVRCVIKGGTVNGGNLECCTLRDSTDVKSTVTMRCCHASYCRVQVSHPANCYFDRCVLKECPLVMQSTISNCELQQSAIVHCKLWRCTIDGRVRDEGANLLEMCTMQSVVFCPETLETVEVKV